MKNYEIADWSVATLEQKVQSTIAYIRMLMHDKHISVRMISEALQIPDSTLERFMAGKVLRPDWINVIEIVRYLGGSVDLLCGLSHDSEIKRLRRKIAALSNQAKFASNPSRKLHAMIVDDVSLNVELIRWMLDKKEITYAIATNGEEAVNLYLGSPEGTFDFILMDVVMPVMDGVQATQKIRSSDRWDNDLPIICTTVKNIKEAGFDVESSGFDDIMYKPINTGVFDKILESIYRYVKRKNIE